MNLNICMMNEQLCHSGLCLILKQKNEIFKFSDTERHYEICVTECKIV